MQTLVTDTVSINRYLTGTLKMLLALTCKDVYNAILDYQYSRLMQYRAAPYVILDEPCFRGCSDHCNLLYVPSIRRVQCCDCLYMATISKRSNVFPVQKAIDFTIAGHHHSLWKPRQTLPTTGSYGKA